MNVFQKIAQGINLITELAMMADDIKAKRPLNVSQFSKLLFDILTKQLKLEMKNSTPQEFEGALKAVILLFV